MFDNIGRKIKRVAEIVCGIGIGISCTSAVILLVVSCMGRNFLGIFLSILIGVVGSLISWVSSFAMYGFGQLIENSDILVENTGEMVAQGRSSKVNYKQKQNRHDEKIKTVSEADLQKQLKNNQNQTEDEFLSEIKKAETADLKLILSDQADLYSDEELKQIELELKRRTK